MIKMRCMKVRTATGAYTGDDGHATPCRAYVVAFRNVEEQSGPQWGVADMSMTILHSCHFVEGQVYDFEV